MARTATGRARHDGITGPRKAAGWLDGCATATWALGAMAAAGLGYQVNVLAGVATLAGAVVAAMQIHGQAAMLRWLAAMYETTVAEASPSARPADRPPPRSGREA
jgi:hypothetical protein